MVTETETRPSFGERMKQIKAAKEAGQATGARVDEKPLPRTVSAAEAFIARNTGDVLTTEHFTADEGVKVLGKPTIYHESPGRVQMWKPGADGHYTPRQVANSAIAQLLKHGWLIACPDCGTNHEDSPYTAKDPNSCPKREPIAWTRCPVVTCGKRLFDNLARQEPPTFDASAPDAAAALDIAGADRSTPQDRVQHEFLMHMWHRHPREAEMRNLPRLTQDLMPVQPGR